MFKEENESETIDIPDLDFFKAKIFTQLVILFYFSLYYINVFKYFKRN